MISDKDQLAILQYNLSLSSPADRWRPILERMILQLRERLEGFGVDPSTIAPSPWGAGPHSPVSIVGKDECHPGRLVRFVGETIVPSCVDLDIDIRAQIRIRVKDIE